ncbi:hypothetical protein GOV10_06590 [Candidatus Woesearchaeota archaeon]|nr:hypothetical protein [Candidatus Woesearchaeota archaeon]
MAFPVVREVVKMLSRGNTGRSSSLMNKLLIKLYVIELLREKRKLSVKTSLGVPSLRAEVELHRLLKQAKICLKKEESLFSFSGVLLS